MSVAAVNRHKIKVKFCNSDKIFRIVAICAMLNIFKIGLWNEVGLLGLCLVE